MPITEYRWLVARVISNLEDIVLLVRNINVIIEYYGEKNVAMTVNCVNI